MLNPQLKTDEGLFDYHLFFRLCPKFISKEFISLLENYAHNLKPTLYSEEFSGLEKVMHFSYVVKNLFTFNSYDTMDNPLNNLADI